MVEMAFSLYAFPHMNLKKKNPFLQLFLLSLLTKELAIFIYVPIWYLSYKNFNVFPIFKQITTAITNITCYCPK